MNFSDLIKSNKQNVKNIIRLITKQENEDLEQEVYIRVLKNVDKYEERGSFKSWISTVAKNVSKDYLKSAGFKNSQNTTSDEYTLVISSITFEELEGLINYLNSKNQNQKGFQLHLLVFCFFRLLNILLPFLILSLFK